MAPQLGQLGVMENPPCISVFSLADGAALLKVSAILVPVPTPVEPPPGAAASTPVMTVLFFVLNTR